MFSPNSCWHWFVLLSLLLTSLPELNAEKKAGQENHEQHPDSRKQQDQAAQPAQQLQSPVVPGVPAPPPQPAPIQPHPLPPAPPPAPQPASGQPQPVLEPAAKPQQSQQPTGAHQSHQGQQGQQHGKHRQKGQQHHKIPQQQAGGSGPVTPPPVGTGDWVSPVSEGASQQQQGGQQQQQQQQQVVVPDFGSGDEQFFDDDLFSAPSFPFGLGSFGFPFGFGGGRHGGHHQKRPGAGGFFFGGGGFRLPSIASFGFGPGAEGMGVEQSYEQSNVPGQGGRKVSHSVTGTFNNGARGKPIEGNGKETREERQIQGQFAEISVSGIIELLLNPATPAPQGKVVLEGESNLLREIEVRVENHTLLVKMKPHISVRTHKALKATVTAAGIHKLSVAGTSKIIVQSPVNDNALSLQASGLSSIQMPKGGQVRTLECTASGTAFINAGRLQATDARVRAVDFSRVHVHVNANLHAEVDSMSQVLYRGKPKVKAVRHSPFATIAKVAE